MWYLPKYVVHQHAFSKYLTQIGYLRFDRGPKQQETLLQQSVIRAQWTEHERRSTNIP